MKTNYLKILSIIFLLLGCSSGKGFIVESDDYNNAVKTAIYDFLKTSILSNEDSVFSIDIEEIKGNILGVSIMGAINKLSPTPENKIGTNQPYFPTRYYLRDNNLFYWYDSTNYVSKEIINILAKYNQIDSLNVNGIVGLPQLINDDSKQAVHYYFCKDNLGIYKKKTTNRAMGYYKIPKLNCK